MKIYASAADLSCGDFPGPGVLEGVVWTAETTCPPDAASPVFTHSTEIRPGVFLVRGTSDSVLAVV